MTFLSRIFRRPRPIPEECRREGHDWVTLTDINAMNKATMSSGIQMPPRYSKYCARCGQRA